MKLSRTISVVILATHFVATLGCGPSERSQAEQLAQYLNPASYSYEDARKMIEDDPRVIHYEDRFGDTAIHQLADLEGSIEAFSLVIENGADVNRISFHTGSPLTALVSFSDDPEKVRLLLDAGADPNIQAPQASRNDYSPLHGACRNGNPEIVKLLIGRGADVNIKVLRDLSSEGLSATPMHAAVNVQGSHKGHIEVVKILLENGAEINALDQFGNTPLDLLVGGRRGSQELFDVLIESGAKRNSNSGRNQEWFDQRMRTFDSNRTQ